ncbi:hypothetical protein BCR36DRAFT_322545 [Piromyces finnis]|uniref:Mannosyltransferase n=1 Tax=Piromyces finnis TaxID=1754191 RepID=A0A1Y1VFJ3_9FUNG|nr:hypothetical protein BCR36DRAFT_322545 [Piromyces finnis]|eukprot:ORX54212.1 hypothetical protein BCR36DRAFT_322545 [Piromyces finnis]
MKSYKDKINFRNKIKIKADKYINTDSINSTFTTARAITAALSNQTKKKISNLQRQQLPNLLKYTQKTFPKKPIYVLLVILRIIYAFLPAYFHPNEYYEKTELKDSSKFLEPKSQQILNFEKDNPCSSIMPASLAVGIPFKIAKYIVNCLLNSEYEKYITNSTIFILYRLYFLIFTFVIDISIYNIRSLQLRDPYPPLLLFASSHLILTFYQRPFSNTFEEILLIFSLWTFLACVPPRQANLRERKMKGSGASRRAIGNIQLNGFRAFFLGFIFILGTYTRLSFAVFILPILFAYLYICYNRQAPNKFTRLINRMYEIMPLALGMVVSIVIMVIADSLYFGTLNIIYDGKYVVTLENVMEVLNAPEKIASIKFTGHLVVTPINNLLKNISEMSKLNCVHILYNMPLLYGPLYFIGIYYAFQSLAKSNIKSRDINKTVSIYCILLGLISLTIFPQPETKYLESLNAFMALALADKISNFIGKEKIIFFTIYIIFNVYLTLEHLIIHHGGIVPNTPTVQVNDFLNIRDIIEIFF